MARKRKDSLSRKTGTRRYRPVCWVSAEGVTEKDYLRMAAFKDAPVSVRFPKDIHPGRHNPSQVLKRFKRRCARRISGVMMRHGSWSMLTNGTRQSLPSC